MADEQIINTIRKYIYLLNKRGFAINKAILYGSYVTGKTHESSDIDLMLISENHDENDIKKKSLAWTLTRIIDSRIEPYLISPERFKSDESSPLLEIVRNEGMEISF